MSPEYFAKSKITKIRKLHYTKIRKLIKNLLFVQFIYTYVLKMVSTQTTPYHLTLPEIYQSKYNFLYFSLMIHL